MILFQPPKIRIIAQAARRDINYIISKECFQTFVPCGFLPNPFLFLLYIRAYDARHYENEDGG
jgi:hypothetical protein